MPTKINKLKDVNDLPAKYVGKDKATAGWASVKTIDVNIYIVKRNTPAFDPKITILNNTKFFRFEFYNTMLAYLYIKLTK